MVFVDKFPTTICNSLLPAEMYLIKSFVIELSGTDVTTVEIVVVNKPLPCVAATNSLSEVLYLSMCVLTFGKPLLFGIHCVDVPLICEVDHTPNSVARRMPPFPPPDPFN